MKMKKQIIRLINISLATMLVLLGFSNCEPRKEYGVPNADYTVKGKIVDKADLKPIKGIRIGYGRYKNDSPVLMYGVIPTDYRTYKSDTTDTNGAFNLTDHFSIEEYQSDSIPVFVQDIDGEENGLYQDTIINIDFKDASRSGKPKGWYSGKFTVEKNIKLKRKTDE